VHRLTPRERCRSNMHPRAAARRLGVHRATLYRRMLKLGID
ncbi:MAG TPA: hypothetical protein EYQ31_01810, partial [Candidatus Handelsmanbacteria bacterium]|nr:hypothetical protein [Candidatus Handelsmanbacteria bacterium]